MKNYLNFKIELETKCDLCIYIDKCYFNKKVLCLNYKYNESKSKWNCFDCYHKLNRYNSNSIPCFLCKKFKSKKVRTNKMSETIETQETFKSEFNKPECQLSGEDGNVFQIIGRVTKALKKDDQPDRAKEFFRKAMKCDSYDKVLQLCFDYVEVL